MSLIAELRTRADYEADRPSGWRVGNAEKFREAATQLEAMQAEIDRLRTKFHNLADEIEELDTTGMSDWEDGYSTAIRKAAGYARASLDNSKEGEK